MMSYIPDFQKRRQQDSYGADIMQNSSYIVIILTVFLVLNMFTQHNYCAVNIYVLDIWQFVMCRWWFLVCHINNRSSLLGQVPLVQYSQNGWTQAAEYMHNKKGKQSINCTYQIIK